MWRDVGRYLFKIKSDIKGISASYSPEEISKVKKIQGADFSNCKNALYSIDSPDGNINVLLHADETLKYCVKFNGDNVIDESELGIVSKKINFGAGVAVGKPKRTFHDETYNVNGKHKTARDVHYSYLFPIRHVETGLEYMIEFRLWNDGVGFRYIFGKGTKLLISEEKTEFNMPLDSVCYFQTDVEKLQGKTVKTETRYLMKEVTFACLTTFELADNKGYVMLTESNLKNYPGCAFRSYGFGKLKVDFWDSYEFYVEDCVSPWRLAIICPDLKSFADNDVVTNSADPMLPAYENADWINYGKASWSFYIDEEKSRNFQTLMEYNKYIEDTALTDYSIVDSDWRMWGITETGAFRKIKKLADDAEKKGMKGIWIWKAITMGPYLSIYRKWFFNQCVKAGVKGIKLDYIESESQFQINLYRKFLVEAAEHKLMVVFHNPQKPTGLERTYPNLLTMEAVHGLQGVVDPDDTTILPFTRFAVSGADYTPICFNNPNMCKTGTWTHQVASSVVLYSPLMTFADRPDLLAKTEAYNFLKNLPSVWDESVCMQASKIGEVAAFARRNGDNWYIGILNSRRGDRTIEVSFDFLDEGVTYIGEAFFDNPEERCDMLHKRIKAVKKNRIRITLSSGGGFACVLYAQSKVVGYE